MAVSAPLSTEGWVALDKDAISGKLEWQTITLRPFEDTDIDIEVLYCGICGTDTHAIQNSWNMTVYPCCPGHEIVGTVIRVGDKVKAFIPGDTVGVGPQGYACLRDECIACGRGLAMRCPRFVPSYNGVWQDGKTIHHGGMAKIHRANMNVVVKIPETLPAQYAAPMLCAGITAWSPLRRHQAGPGKRIGVIGIGGIGHFALLWAKALGCERVVAINRSSAKKHDCLSFLGADAFISMTEDKDWAVEHAGSLDLIISTSDSGDMPMNELLGLLTFHGTFVTVGASPEPLQNLNTFTLCAGMVKIEGSFWGTFDEIEEMLQFAAAKNLTPTIEVHPLKNANLVIVNQARGMARYKYVVQVQ